MQIHLKIFLLLLLCSSSLPASSGSSCGDATCSEGLLWEIRQSDIHRGYLFGTIHLEDPEITALPEIVEQSLLASKTYVMEVEMHPLAMQIYTERSRLDAGKSLDQLINKQDYLNLSQLVSRQYGLDETLLRRLKPWTVFNLLSRPPPKSGRIQDLVLEEMAKQAHLDTAGLETMEELLDALDSLSMEDQLAILRDTVNNYSIIEQQFSELKEKYLQRDLAGMMAINNRGHDDKKLFTRFMDRLLYGRNARMLPRIRKLLQKGDVFIAVESLHLQGERGLLCGLAIQGYQLKRLY